MEVKVKILAKKGDNKAFKASDENWYNVNDVVIPYLEKLNKGDEVIVTYEKKGISRYVSKIVKASEVKEELQKESSTGFACEVCGKELKDDKFKLCYMCNKKGLKPNKEPVAEPIKKEWKPYDNPEKTAQIQRGNALNAASMVASGTSFSDIETAAQFTLELAERFVEWLRAE